MAETTIKIEGMSCQHCVMRVKKALDALQGVLRAEVSVGSASVDIDETKIKKEDVEAAIEKAGYKVVR
ncbi:MAG: cation transporter [Alphaproteobacteria bacterium]|uniref:Cation transporter n=1 Tax=Candidatus Nitrobium versatile TaxID=2884831 RepID=A0A953JF56_9BACT|nr:cation transporter [Candidatus Nitrobium versatile]